MSEEWKRSADVVIIGAGIQGCSIAYNLAKMGVKDVIVIDKDYPTAGSTGRCAAGIRAQWGTKMNCQLGLASLEILENLNEELGMDIGLHQGGYLMVAYRDSEFEQLKKNVALQNSLGIASRVVTKEEAYEICPALSAEDAVGFTYHHRDGHADPFLTTIAYHKAASDLGVRFYKFTECTGVKVKEGKIQGVVTNRGEIDTPVVVDAAGPYSQHIATMAGINLPLYSERHEILVTEPIEFGACPCMLMSFSGNYYMQQRPIGAIIAGCSPEGHPEDYSLGTSWDFLEHMSRVIVKMLPKLAGVRVVRQWSGMYNMTPDKQPVICESKEVKGFYISAGFSGHGYMFGPISGKLIAELITMGTTSIPIEPLNYDRFEKGELIEEPAVV